MVLTALDREGMASLLNGEYERVCELCEATCDDGAKALLELLVAERLPGDVVEEGGVLWNTLWIGVNTETGEFIGAVHVLGKPSEGGELNIAIHPVDRYDDSAFVRVFERVVKWAFSHRSVYYLRLAATGEDEIALLQRCGFIKNCNDGLYEREKAMPMWSLYCACLGMATGLALGDVFGGVAAGVAVGSLFGAVIGQILDYSDTTKRKPK